MLLNVANLIYQGGKKKCQPTGLRVNSLLLLIGQKDNSILYFS
jgi:hypothetical protein